MTTTRTHFTFRVDTWTPDGESIVEHVASRRTIEVARVRITEAGRRALADAAQEAPSRAGRLGPKRI
jgi:hypothetical protein